jgi:hypothetical protein
MPDNNFLQKSKTYRTGVVAMSISKLLITLFICTLSSQYVLAKEFPLRFEELDTDANAFVSKDEAKVRKDLVKNFKKIDEDKDGKLSISEYQAYEGKGRYQPPEETETPELGAAPVE